LKQLSPGAAGRREAHRETVGDGETKLSAGATTLIYPHHRQRRKAIFQRTCPSRRFNLLAWKDSLSAKIISRF
jgi:hypothetical protein